MPTLVGHVVFWGEEFVKALLVKELVAVELTLFCVFAQVEAVQVEVDEVLALLAVVVETDQLDDDGLRQTHDLDPFGRVAVLLFAAASWKNRVLKVDGIFNI